ncbi:hypothetical protein [Aeromicrobium sp. UC242_57]|uniref:hypothetical protein n=1 Tax=Aeromicrobium sp. UC242_57 TaxID=3374624 RepID=UPI0037C09928
MTPACPYEPVRCVDQQRDAETSHRHRQPRPQGREREQRCAAVGQRVPVLRQHPGLPAPCDKWVTVRG